MAERRMFSKKIIGSAKFLKMPISTQCLYFHLGLHADDDGVVEAYNIIRSIGATEDDLKLLLAKSYIVILNEDLVTFITDWREHNNLRSDRKIDSIYKTLLLRVLPNTQFLEPKKRADTGKMTKQKCAGQQMDVQWTVHGRTMDGIGEDRVGEVSIGKDSLGEGSVDKNTHARGEFQNIYIPEEQLTELIKRFSEQEVNKAISQMSAYLKTHGLTYKDYYAALIRWIDKNLNSPQSNKNQSQAADVPEWERLGMTKEKYNRICGGMKRL